MTTHDDIITDDATDYCAVEGAFSRLDGLAILAHRTGMSVGSLVTLMARVWAASVGAPPTSLLACSSLDPMEESASAEA